VGQLLLEEANVVVWEWDVRDRTASRGPDGDWVGTAEVSHFRGTGVYSCRGRGGRGAIQALYPAAVHLCGSK
jgi:hypothetical protein